MKSDLFLKYSEMFKGYAEKARSHKTGKHRGYSVNHAKGMAEHCLKISNGEIPMGTKYQGPTN